jgi:hypothetical protein
MTILMTETQADAFALEWIEAWNAHDAEAITAHYHPDVEYHSPFVGELAGRSSGLAGREALEAYVRAALDRFPELELGPILSVAPGAGSVAIVYRSINDLLAVETLVFDDDGLILAAHCHYRADP